MRREGAMSYSHMTVQAGSVSLEGNVAIRGDAEAIVAFAHGSGNGRHSPRNCLVAEALNAAGSARLLFDLLTPQEGLIGVRTGELRFAIGLLADRLTGAVNWLGAHPPTQTLWVGLFRAST
jgi:putative phosphoribosyl transferase